MNIVAVCHDCKKRHTYSDVGGHALYDRIGEWRVKHPPGRCIVEYIPDLSTHQVINRVHHQYGHNADIKLAYASSAAYTITLTSLASSLTYVAGREGTAVSNTTNNYLDYLVGGVIRVGTTPTVDTSIRIYLYGSVDDTPTYPDVLDGTDSAETITDTELLGVAIPLFAESPVDTTTDQDYWFTPKGIASYFGGSVPKNHGLFVTHNGVAALNATGSTHVLSHTGVYATSI